MEQKVIMTNKKDIIDLTQQNSDIIYISSIPIDSIKQRQQKPIIQNKKIVPTSNQLNQVSQQPQNQGFRKSQKGSVINRKDHSTINHQFYFNKKVIELDKESQSLNYQMQVPSHIQLLNQNNHLLPSNSKQYQIMNISWNQFYQQPQSILYYNPFTYFDFQHHSQVLRQSNKIWNLQTENQQNLFDKQLNKKKQKLCQICLQQQSYLNFVELFNCGHYYHQQCLQKVILSKVQSRYFPLICPDDNCEKIISEQNIKYILSPSNYQKYKNTLQKYKIQQNSHLYFWCQTPNCQYYTQNVSNSGPSFFKCPDCQAQYCMNCNKKWHYGPCNLTKTDQEFLRFARKKLFKTCPKCRRLVQKVSGCHHIVCLCKFQFCYICEKDYRNQCKCKSLSFAQHRILMSNQRKQQKQIARKQAKIKREEQRMKRKQFIQYEKQQKRKKRQEKRLERLTGQNRIKKILKEEDNIEPYQRKLRKVVKKDICYKQ